MVELRLSISHKMYQIQNIIYYLFLTIAATLFIHDSILLFIRGKNNRPRQMLGTTTMIWGIMYSLLIIVSLNGRINFPILSGGSLVSSHFFICVMFLFPLEVLLPGWLTMKRGLLMFTPISVLSIIYYCGLQITGQHIEEFTTYSDLIDSIGRFNVWYRFVILACNFLFIYFLMEVLNKNEGKYIKWQRMNFSDQENVDITWFYHYKNIVIVICSCYVLVAVWGSIWSVILHTLVVIVGFSILFYKGLFYESSYAEDLSNTSIGSDQEVVGEEDLMVGMEEEKRISEGSFEVKLPVYVEQLRKWMDVEKPYLYKEFKLIDVTRVLPLNRSYLSRVFNEGFHQNFSEVVRKYRIEYAKELMLKHPDLPMYKISESCGFSSDSTFFRAFQQVTGTTPKQFKSQM